MKIEHICRIVRDHIKSMARCEASFWSGYRHASSHAACLSRGNCSNSDQRTLDQLIRFVSEALLLLNPPDEADDEGGKILEGSSDPWH